MNAESDFLDYIRGKKGKDAESKAGRAQHLVQVGTLKQLAVQGKIKHCIGWIEEFLEVEDKLVVFCVHRNVVADLMDHFGGIAVKIVGGMTAQQKEKAYTSFQTSSKIKLFVGNIEAAGVAIDLYAASHVAFLELPWTPGDMVQAEDRLLRIGQENNVTVHFLLAQDTIDEKMASLLDRKAKVIAAVTDGTEIKQESMLTELINEYLEV
jgi:SWI/SNF-related matrix-associated actin-dependent regulator 1 of chromatin subfamily A